MVRFMELMYQLKITTFLDYLLYIILFTITIWTMYHIINLPIKEHFSQIRYRSKLRRKRSTKNTKSIDERSTLYKHIYFLLKSVNDKHDTDSVSNFLVICGALFIIVFLFSIVKFEDFVMSLVFGILVSIIPYLLFQVKLRNMRNTVSNQVNHITETLVSAYSASAYNMYETLKYTHANIEDPNLKRVFSRLISDIQTSRNDDEIRVAIDVFIYTCGDNSWSKRLGNVIFKAYINHENVSNTLITLQEQIQNTEKMLQQEMSESMDAVYDGYLPIIVLPASLLLGYYVTGPQDWFKLQFGQTWSLFIFIITLLFAIFSVMVSLLLRKPKNDL